MRPPAPPRSHDYMDIELTLNGEAVALLVRNIGALEEHFMQAAGAPEWIGETLGAMTEKQRIRALARLLAAVHNPYRDGQIRIHVWGDAPDLEGRIDYSCRNPYDEGLRSAAVFSAATAAAPSASAAASRVSSSIRLRAPEESNVSETASRQPTGTPAREPMAKRVAASISIASASDVASDGRVRSS
jgi:hypothetical protein